MLIVVSRAPSTHWQSITSKIFQYYRSDVKIALLSSNTADKKKAEVVGHQILKISKDGWLLLYGIQWGPVRIVPWLAWKGADNDITISGSVQGLTTKQQSNNFLVQKASSWYCCTICERLIGVFASRFGVVCNMVKIVGTFGSPEHLIHQHIIAGSLPPDASGSILAKSSSGRCLSLYIWQRHWVNCVLEGQQQVVVLFRSQTSEKLGLKWIVDYPYASTTCGRLVGEC